MNKRGQIYIVAALILSVVIFLLISQTNFVQRILIEDDFEQISENFNIESAKFMNSLLAGGEIEDVESEFQEFTEKFTDYVKVENPEFEYIYVLEYKGQKIAGGYVKSEVIIGSAGESLGVDAITSPGILTVDGGASITIVSSGKGEVKSVDDTSSITIAGYKYKLEIEPGAPQIIIISREEKGEQTKVYLNEDFVTGEKIGG